MTFRANKSGTWVGGDDQSQGTVVYGKSGGNWLYAKEVFAKKDGTWTRAWTDCRQHDASGRDWGSSSSAVTVSCGGCDSCGTNTKVVTTVTYTKTGCPTYTRSSETGCTGCTGAWSDYFDFVCIPVSGGTYSYVGGSIWGWLYYTDSGCNNSVTCASQSLLGPGNVQYCSVTGGYRVTGTDQCIFISI
jgi:hypothetical protein